MRGVVIIKIYLIQKVFGNTDSCGINLFMDSQKYGSHQKDMDMHIIFTIL